MQYSLWLHIGMQIYVICWFYMDMIHLHIYMLYWKKCLFFDNVLLQTLARCCYDNIGSLCDIYKPTIKNLVDLP